MAHRLLARLHGATVRASAQRAFATVAPSPFQRPLTSLETMSDVDAAVETASRVNQTGVSLLDLQQFGQDAEEHPKDTLLRAAAFLARELPIRFAHRIVELNRLPYGMSEMPSVQVVAEWYKTSFKELVNAPVPRTLEEEAVWAQRLMSIYERHGPTLVTMAKAVWELKQAHSSNTDMPLVEQRIFRYLDRFYTSRIGIRTLIAQHLALREKREGYIGIINTQTSPTSTAWRAIDDARYMCERTYGEVPEVHVHGDDGFTFPFIPSHLEHMLFELVKNSMRAVVEAHGDKAEMPPVKVVIAANDQNEDVVIKVSDEGGGIPRTGVNRIWSYFFTTYPTDFGTLLASPNDFSVDTPLAGLGYGLPLSRLYARYFGGDLQIISMEGFGTDAYLHLKNVGDAKEPVNDLDDF